MAETSLEDINKNNPFWFLILLAPFRQSFTPIGPSHGLSLAKFQINRNKNKLWLAHTLHIQSDKKDESKCKS